MDVNIKILIFISFVMLRYISIFVIQNFSNNIKRSKRISLGGKVKIRKAPVSEGLMEGDSGIG